MKRLVEKIDQTLDWRWLPSLSRWMMEQAIAIQQIPAPTFHEAQRSAYVADQFRSLDLALVETDPLHNVYGLWLGGDQKAPAAMITAHTDTVFSVETDLTTRTDGALIYGPGLGDNSIGVAALLGIAYALRHQYIQPDGNIWLVATVGEEGLGDLCGMKAAFARLKPYVQSVINLEGLAFEHVYHAGIAVRRLHITAHTEGGHSWLNFGRASAIHGIVQLGARITTLQPPAAPRTTYNIGLIEGGQSINTIASTASLWLDIRSEDQATLAEFERQIRAEVEALTTSELRFTIEVVGDRPAGRLSPEHPLVQGALAALSQLGVTGVLETGSTDANIPLAAGCPAVTVGLTRGGNAHRLDEYVNTEPLSAGLRQLILLALAATSREFL
jgi:acetylornithine deacetylase/succinyl-diaminopimelate desuccinylase-like protein